MRLKFSQIVVFFVPQEEVAVKQSVYFVNVETHQMMFRDTTLQSDIL